MENNVAENNQKEEESFSHYTPMFRRCNDEYNPRRGGLMFGEPLLADSLRKPKRGSEK